MCHEGCHRSCRSDRRAQAAAAGAGTAARPAARDPRWRRPVRDRDRFHSHAAEEAGQGAGGGTGREAPSAHRRAGPRHAGARTAVRAADSSLVVAAFASWHEKHDAARRVLNGALRLIEHCVLETYSVLTRLPAPHRAPGDVVREDRKSTRLNSSHTVISYAVFCLKKKKNKAQGDPYHKRNGAAHGSRNDY